MDTAARARLDRWTQSLFDKAERLIDLADHGVPMPGDPVRLVFALVGGSRLPLEASEALTALVRTERDALADGEHVVWLAVGTLTYADRDGHVHVAPLVLWPVALAAEAGITKAIAAPDRAPRVNDALVAKLALLDIALDTGPELDLVKVLEAAEALCTEARAGWKVERSARLAAFSFAELDMWKDLVARDLTGPDASVPLQWLLGELAPPVLAKPAQSKAQHELVLPLDADGSQVAAVAAAAAGGSFVVQGPPGTGKSQTIANLLVQCASQGMSVLVVSDRIAALEAVHKRLASVGLAEVCAVAGQPIERTSRPHVNAPAGAAVVRTRLAEVAAALDAHVEAMHGNSLGFTVHEVMARLVELRTTPRAALAEPDAASLDRATFERRKRAVTELADAALAVEPVAAHPWRASALAAWTGDGTLRAKLALETAGEAAWSVASALVEVGKLVPGIVARTPEQLRAVGLLAQVAAGSPRPGVELLTGPRGRAGQIDEEVALVRARGGGKVDVPRDPVSFLAIAQRQRALVAEIDAVFLDASVLDAGELWAQLKKWTTSMGPLRYVALRTARAAVRAAAMADAPLATDVQMLVALEAVIAERACRAALIAATEPATRWFGALAGDPLTLDLGRLEAALAWTLELRKAFDQVTVTFGEPGRQTAWRALIAQVAQTMGSDNQSDLLAFAKLGDAIARWEPALVELSTATGIPAAQLGAGPDHVTALRTQIDALAAAVEGLAEWTRFHLARRAAVDAGIRAPIAAIERADLEARELALAWERATLLAWADAAVKRAPELSHFDGAKQHMVVTSFSDLDRGAMAVMRGRLPKLAPCVLATPQAIARCALPMFDLVVFDEASRLPIAHALGALARARATIVVGDVRQPVPNDGAHGLLDVALAAGLPELVLTTHYRSRHHDLFAFANRRYYFDLVEVLPSPVRGGLTWRRVDGAAEVTGANRMEAEEIVADLKAKLADQPRASIAVITLSRAQQYLIEDLLAAAQLRSSGDDSILVGTPDRLQGAERDLVYLSLGDRAESFGHPGAERLLAVAATRARQQLVVVSSFAPEDVSADAPAAARGLAELVAFARDGGSPLGEELAPASAVTAAIARALAERGWTLRHRVGPGASAVELAVVDPDDPQRCVLAIEHDGVMYRGAQGTRERDRLRMQVLADLGWRTHRVWTLDWWLDPERETMRAHGAIIAAVAANRHKKVSGPVAAAPAPALKSRRRLAQGTESSAPTAMVSATGSDQLAAAGSDKIAAAGPVRGPSAAGTGPSLLRGGRPAIDSASGSGPTLATADTSPVRLPRGAITIGPYTAAAIPCGRRVPDDMFTGRHTGELAKVVEQVLAAEAPIHVDLLARRAAAYFGVGRVTPRIVDQIRTVLEGRARVGDEPDVLWRADQDPSTVPSVRVAGTNAVACRDITEIPLSEVASAARIVVERASGLGESELVRDCARLLGFARITERVTDRVARGVELARTRELIAIENGRAHLLS
jgi:hypothetical protein